MIVVVRIAGQVNISESTKETLSRIKLRKKYSAVLLPDNEGTQKLLRSVRNYISYGKIKTETLAKLLSLRAKPLEAGKKIDAQKLMSEIDKKPMNKLGIKPFFALHPPRGGIDSKRHAGQTVKSVLGENEKINELVERML